MKYLYLSIAIIAEVIATSFLKSSEGFTKLFQSAIVIIGYSVAFFFLSLSIKEIPVGIVYAIWSGCGIVLISIIGVVFYKQNLDIWAIIGILFILFGVLIMKLISKSIA